VFGVTNFWEHFEKEHQHGRNLVEAVADSGVDWFVFSTLPSVVALSGGELEAPHFDIKARLEEYARGLGVPGIYLHCAFYYENFLNFMPLSREPDGSLAFGFPQGDTPLAMVSAADVGGVVAAILERPAEFRDRVVGVVGDDAPCPYYAEVMSRRLGRKVVYRHVPREEFAALGFPGAGDLANMFDFNRRFIPNRRKDLEQSRSLYPQIGSFDSWMAKNRERFATGAGAG
jgi:uncharacterized protein YbjT (DUF2867 family)